MSFQPPPDNYARTPQRNPLLPDSRSQPHSYSNSYAEKQPASRPSGPAPNNNEGGNYQVGILPGLAERGGNYKHEYGKVLMNQAKEREMNEKRKKNEEREFEKRLLEQRMSNDPFGKDRERYLNAYHRMNRNARNGFVGIGNQIVNQAPSLASLKEEVYERPEPEIVVPPPVNNEKNNEEIRKAIQQEEMRRAYEEQMIDQEKRRLEEIRRKVQEEKDEVERMRNLNSMQLMKQTEENNKMLQQQIMMQNFAQQSYMSFMAQTAQAAQMQQQYVAQMLATPPPIQKREPTPPPMPEPEEPEIPAIDFDAIRELEEEKLRAIKASMYTDMSRQVNNVVNNEMNRLKYQMGQQTHMLKDQLLTLKNQVLMAEELKQDANSELDSLKKEMQGLDIYEDIRKRNLSKYLKNVSHLYMNTDPISDNGNFDFQFPTRRYRPTVNKDTGNYELAAEIHHLPVNEPRYNPRFDLKDKGKAPDVLLRQSMGGQYGIPQDDYINRTRPLILPDHIDLNTKNPYYQEARTANHLKGKEFDILDHIDGDAFDRNEKRLAVLDNLYHDHESRKLDNMLRDSLLKEQGGWGSY